MASIQKRGSRWFARYRDGTGHEHGQRFDRKVDAQTWLNEQTAALVTGQYCNPQAGKITFREYAEQWRAAQVHRTSSAAHVETMLRRHAYPAFDDRQISTIRPSEIQTWVKGSPLAPTTVHVLHGVVSTIFRAAVRDRIIPSSPCEATKLPRKLRRTVVPLAVEAVTALASAVPPRYRALVMLCAGTGLRQGEAFGLTQDRVNFLKRRLTVDRQLIGQDDGRPRFGPPKTAASVRTVPLPDVVAEALAEHCGSSAPARTGCCSSMTTGYRYYGHGSPVMYGARPWPLSKQSLPGPACTICGTSTPRCSSGTASQSRRCSPGSGTQQPPRH